MNSKAAQSLGEIGLQLDAMITSVPDAADAEQFLELGEQVLEHWVRAGGKEPTQDQREGFRVLALHRQGADKDPSFNACRETCRELVYHYNLLIQEPDHPDTGQRARMMAWVARHLYLFISGKMESQELGDFCCASRPLREKVDPVLDAQ